MRAKRGRGNKKRTERNEAARLRLKDRKDWDARNKRKWDGEIGYFIRGDCQGNE